MCPYLSPLPAPPARRFPHALPYGEVGGYRYQRVLWRGAQPLRAHSRLGKAGARPAQQGAADCPLMRIASTRLLGGSSSRRSLSLTKLAVSGVPLLLVCRCSGIVRG